jgi:serine/threonine protein phosphatase PrpC
MLRVAEQFAGSDTGRQRHGNEDAYLDQAPLFVVADGMGGAQGGEVASKIAIDLFAEGFEIAAGGDPADELADRVAEANARIFEHANEHAELAGMGTTLTAAYVGPAEVSFAHVGDSRAYRFHEGELERLTHDHSLVEEMIRQGQLTEAEAEEHPQRSIITRALGPEPDVAVDLITLDGVDGDVYLLCSDGLTSMVPESELARILGVGKTLSAAGRALIAAANKAGGRDNITVILFRLEDVEGAPPAPTGPPRRRSRAPSREDPPPTAEQSIESGTVEDEVPGAALTPAPDGAYTRPPRAPRRRRLAPRMPIEGSTRAARRDGRRTRRLGLLAVALAIIGLGAGALLLAVQAVYFIGADRYGQVTVYNGLPYTLPGGIKLYTEYFVSGVTTAEIGPHERQRLFGNELLSQSGASKLVKALELGQVQGQNQ